MGQPQSMTMNAVTNPAPGADPFWATYRGARLLALAQAVTPREEAIRAVIARRMQAALGLDQETAARQAHRALLSFRDEWLHSELGLDAPPITIARLLDSLTIEGWRHLRALPPDQGTVFISLHYSLYSSLLYLWLFHCTALGILPRVTMMVIVDHPHEMERFARQIPRWEAAGLVAPGAVQVVERDAAGVFTPVVVREVVARLRAGEAVYFCADPLLVLPTEKRAVVLDLGRRQIGVPGGVPWLAETTGCAVVPVAIRPGADDRHVLTIRRPVYAGDGHDPARPIRAALQTLFDSTVLADPAHWEGWLWLPGADTNPAG